MSLNSHPEPSLRGYFFFFFFFLQCRHSVISKVADHTLFVKHKEGNVTTLIVYVDGIVLTGDDPDEMKLLQEYLTTEFEMKNLGQLKYFLGIEIARSGQWIFFFTKKVCTESFY